MVTAPLVAADYGSSPGGDDMKAIMGFTFFLLFLAGIAFVTMQGKQLIPTGGSGAELTGITWRALTVADEAIPEGSGLIIQFEVDGSIKGHGGCNGFFGSLEQSDSQIKVGPLGSTRMACPEPIMNREMAFMNAVQKMTGFRTADNTMSLLDENGKELATFVAGTDD